MIENHNIKQQDKSEAFTQWTLLPSQNPTDDQIRYYFDQGENLDAYNEEWQEETAAQDRFKGAIILLDLVYFLAKEEIYSEVLPVLWQNFGLNRNNLGRTPKWDISWIRTPQGRFIAWYWLLLRWTIYPYFFSKEGKRVENYFLVNLRTRNDRLLPLYHEDLKEPISKSEVQSPTQYIKLDEFKEYIESIKKGFNLTISLPKGLFPKQGKKEDTRVKQFPGKKNLRPCQKHRLECRKIAEKLWQKNPSMTIVDMMDEQEIISASMRNDGKMYIEKTVRDWIKDLCPNRQPGRRPKGKSA